MGFTYEWGLIGHCVDSKYKHQCLAHSQQSHNPVHRLQALGIFSGSGFPPPTSLSPQWLLVISGDWLTDRSRMQSVRNSAHWWNYELVHHLIA